MMRRNRVVRDKLEEHGGSELIAEVERWNDRMLDSLGNYGVPVTPIEERVQADMFELMAMEETTTEELL
jgi:hypothetical protein